MRQRREEEEDLRENLLLLKEKEITHLYTLREVVEGMRGLNSSEVFIVLKEASKMIERKGSSILRRYFRRCEVVEVPVVFRRWWFGGRGGGAVNL